MFRGCVLLALVLSMLLPTWAIALLETDVAVERVSSYRVQAGDQIRIVLPGEASMAEPFLSTVRDKFCCQKWDRLQSPD